MHFNSTWRGLAAVAVVSNYTRGQALVSTTNQPGPTIEGYCVQNDTALLQLSSQLSPQSAISCLGSPLQLQNADRYWGIQFGKNASVVVYPASTKDVSLTVQAANASPKGRDFAFVSGAHSMTNASSSYGFILDLSWLNRTKIIQGYEVDGKNLTVVGYEGGSNWLGVQTATNGSGYTAVGARMSTVGVGGYSTGGGIGFLAGAYGYATDRLRAMEIVLMSGQIVYATKTNEYSDLFWALQGGGGQFAIVTKFYQEAAPEPVDCTIGVYVISDDSMEQARRNTIDFFEKNTDPFSLMYFAVGYFPADQTNPVADLAPRTLLTALHFGNPKDPSQPDYNTIFTPLLSGVKTTSPPTIYHFPYSDATLLVDPFFPSGFRRGFYGPQTRIITTSYLEKITAQFTDWTAAVLQHGDTPTSAVFVLQYMFPGLNGHLPASNDATAWPHAEAGHQTLFSPGYVKASTDTLTLNATAAFNHITHDQQASAGGAAIADYPNYISPDSTGRQVWGDNVQRLIEVKSKYDPLCRIHNGKVFATKACIQGGYANVFV